MQGLKWIKHNLTALRPAISSAILYEREREVDTQNKITVEPPIKDTIEITSEQRTRFNVPNGEFPNTLLTSDKGQPLNKGQNGQKTMGPKCVRYSKVPL